jgi:hypothetical protein
MRNRETTLSFQGRESASIHLQAGVPQGSPLSPILFLFYNSELMDICTKSTLGVTASGFADDVNILAYSQATATNCRKLEYVHQKCLAWAKRFGLKFVPQKYELAHFTRRRSFNLAASLQLEGTILNPKPDIRVLGVWLDTKLMWSGHVREVNRKMATQIQGLQKVTAFTWGATFSHSRQIYSAMVRSALTFGATAWHTPSGKPERVKGSALKLEKFQNKCLRMVAGAYKATPIRRLETETFTPPLAIYLDRQVAAYQLRHKNSDCQKAIRQACKKIRNRV